MIDIKTYDFKHLVEYFFDSKFHCEESGCWEDSPCRCSTIESYYVTLVNIGSILKEISSNYFDNSTSAKRNNKIDSILGDITPEINLYTIDRILTINKVYDVGNWSINIKNGYYGQEIGSVLIVRDIAEKIEKQLETAFSKTNLIDRITYLLCLEYGYLIPDLSNLKFSFELINKELINFGSISQLKKVKEKDLKYYTDDNYNSIRCVVIESDSGYRLIDGYHRCHSTKLEKVKAIVGRL